MNIKRILLTSIGLSLFGLNILFAEDDMSSNAKMENAPMEMPMAKDQMSDMPMHTQPKSDNAKMENASTEAPMAKDQMSDMPMHTQHKSDTSMSGQNTSDMESSCNQCHKPKRRCDCERRIATCSPEELMMRNATFSRVWNNDDSVGYNNDTSSFVLRDWRSQGSGVLMFATGHHHGMKHHFGLIKKMNRTVETEIIKHGGPCCKFNATFIYVANHNPNHHETPQTVREMLRTMINCEYLENVVVGFLDFNNSKDRALLAHYGIKQCDDTWNKIIFSRCYQKIDELKNIYSDEHAKEMGCKTLVKHIHKMLGDMCIKPKKICTPRSWESRKPACAPCCKPAPCAAPCKKPACSSCNTW